MSGSTVVVSRSRTLKIGNAECQQHYSNCSARKGEGCQQSTSPVFMFLIEVDR